MNNKNTTQMKDIIVDMFIFKAWSVIRMLSIRYYYFYYKVNVVYVNIKNKNRNKKSNQIFVYTYYYYYYYYYIFPGFCTCLLRFIYKIKLYH